MKCPICTTVDLLMTERLGVEIDYCPQCRGVWLDRGELDKIIERSTNREATNPPAGVDPSYREPHHDDHSFRKHEHDDDEHDHYGSGGYQGHGHRKKGFLKDLFDF